MKITAAPKKEEALNSNSQISSKILKVVLIGLGALYLTFSWPKKDCLYVMRLNAKEIVATTKVR